MSEAVLTIESNRPAPSIPSTAPSLIDVLLRTQADLTAVERFADLHGSGAIQTPTYRHLLPGNRPGPGEQYAFEVDLDRCSGCKSCVTGCHTMNGLGPTETWRDVGTLLGGTVEQPFLQTVTTACHHCVEPACLEGCPVLAYEKDPETGIVRHLDDQCIGCQYCVLKCPYDVPKYNADLGIVRKCDMCSARLAEDEAPACVQACPTDAISITIVRTEDAVEAAEANGFLPGAPDPITTIPTTRFRSSDPLPANLLAADRNRVRPEHSHMPLVFMLVLTQVACGTFAVQQLLAASMTGALLQVQAVVALTLGLLALVGSTLHLGRPLYAFRAVLGIRTSWLSREIVAFGVFAGLAALYAGGLLIAHQHTLTSLLGGVVTAVGVGAMWCSVMVYHDTRRPLWHLTYTAPRFFLTAGLLGGLVTLITGFATEGLSSWSAPMLIAVVAAAGLKLTSEWVVLTHLRDIRGTPLRASARLLVGPLRRVLLLRLGLGVVGGVILPLALLAALGPGISAPDALVLLVAATVFSLAGELAARTLFFVAVVAPSMPGRG